MKSAVLWNVTLCGLGNRYTHFGGTVSVEERYSLETQATCSCKTLVFMYKTTHCYILPVLHWLFGPCRPRASFRINFQMSLSLAIFLQPLTFFFVRHYSSSWTLASSKIVLHCTRSCVVVYIRFALEFLFNLPNGEEVEQFCDYLLENYIDADSTFPLLVWYECTA